MKIYLIRHGQTTGDIEDRYGGDYDDHLSTTGRREARDLATEIKSKNIRIIYSSPRIRAVETAKIVNNLLNVEIKIIDGLRERNNYGVLTGMVKAEAKARYPFQVEQLETGIRHKVDNSENYDLFKKRVVQAFEQILDNRNHDSIAIITHGGPIKCIVREVLELGELSELGDCAIITLEKTRTDLSLESMERASLNK